MLKRILVVCGIIFINDFGYSQTVKQRIEWKALIGKWECQKVILIKGKDSTNISEQYRPYFTNYSMELKYKEEYPITGTSTTVEGGYKTDKTKNIISFSQLTWITKYSNGKAAVSDVVYESGKQELHVLKLTPDLLLLLQKYAPNTEAQGDYLFYMTKIK